jgi:hypothetical protein
MFRAGMVRPRRPESLPFVGTGELPCILALAVLGFVGSFYYVSVYLGGDGPSVVVDESWHDGSLHHGNGIQSLGGAGITSAVQGSNGRKIIKDHGYADRERGWYDAQCLGRADDYCRFVGDNGGWFACALAGVLATDQHQMIGMVSECGRFYDAKRE